MSTYTQIIYQIVFSTKERKPILKEDNRPQLFRFIHGLLQNKKCHLYRINAVEDHMHLLIALPPSISLSSLIKDTKLASSDFIRRTIYSPDLPIGKRATVPSPIRSKKRIN